MPSRQHRMHSKNAICNNTGWVPTVIGVSVFPRELKIRAVFFCLRNLSVNEASCSTMSNRFTFAGDSSGLHGTMPKNPVQPLELKSENRKITFPENFPVYTEPEEVAENIAVRSSGPTGKNSTAGSRLYASSQAGSAAREKSRKFYQAGLQAQYKGDTHTAEIFYNKALEEVEHHMDAMINLSALYVQQERYDEAEEILAEILEIEPTNSKGLVNMGVVNLYRDNESRAAAQFEAALAANPLEENALVNLAYLAEKNSDYVSTEAYYRQLLQISPGNLEILLAYGHLLEGLGRYPEALALYADTLELGTLKKDKRLYSRILDRMRLLSEIVKNSQP